MQPYAVLAALSNCYPPLEGRSFIRYSPFRRSPFPKELLARLAWNKHVATVRSEPGSNPSNKKFFLFCLTRISSAHTLVLSLFPFFQRSKISAKPKLNFAFAKTNNLFANCFVLEKYITTFRIVKSFFSKIFRFCFLETSLKHS